MMIKLAVRAIVTDIEGTTTPLTFVNDVLFPYALAHIRDFIKKQAHQPEVEKQIAETRRLANINGDSLDAVADVLIEWIDADKKVTPLKALQGMIWEQGYRQGAFTAQIYDDAVDKLHEWHDAHIPLYIYSSGSVMAQKLLFGHTPAGDLTPLFSGYFDTTIGGKLESASYDAIAKQINIPHGEILFLSDSRAELDAANAVGFQVIQLYRDGKILADTPVGVVDFNPLVVSRVA